MDIKSLHRSIDRIGTIRKSADSIIAQENLDSKGRPYAYMVGQLSGAINGILWDIDAIKAAIPELEHVDRAYKAFANMDIDIDASALTALGLIGSERRYRHLRNKIADALDAAISEVQDDEREAERERVTAALAGAGFILDESKSEDATIYIRGLDQVSIEMNYIRGVTSYQWELKRDGEIVESGTNEFSRLIAAVSSVKVEA